jgi:hypothetical protein
MRCGQAPSCRMRWPASWSRWSPAQLRRAIPRSRRPCSRPVAGWWRSAAARWSPARGRATCSARICTSPPGPSFIAPTYRMARPCGVPIPGTGLRSNGTRRGRSRRVRRKCGVWTDPVFRGRGDVEARRGGSLRGARRPSAQQAPRTTGHGVAGPSVNSNRLPLPSSDVAATRPWWRSTIRRTFARPMPVPSNSLAACRR